MTAQTRTVNKARYENGDQPQGSDYIDLIDSFVTIADSTAQAITSDLTAPAFIATTKVSAPTVNCTTLNVTAVSAATANFTGTVSAANGYFDALKVGGNEVLPSGAGATGELYLTVTAATTCSSQGTFVIINGDTSAEASFLTQFNKSADMTLQYIGANTKNFHAVAHTSIRLASGTNKDFAIRIAKNGTSIPKSEMRRRVSNATDYGAVTTGCFLSMVSGDTVSVMAANITDTTNMEAVKTILVIQEA